MLSTILGKDIEGVPHRGDADGYQRGFTRGDWYGHTCRDSHGVSAGKHSGFSGGFCMGSARGATVIRREVFDGF